MFDRITSVLAPSNIALIKYMGKEDPSSNLPLNGSLSLTLNHLCTAVEIQAVPGKSQSSTTEVRWTPELPRFISERQKTTPLPFQIPSLSEAGIERMRKHVNRVQKNIEEILPKYGIQLLPSQSLELRTANTFPASSGIASSASSFAGLTLATALAYCQDQDRFKQVWSENTSLRRELARVTRQGSGSSCRSFEGPWVIWEGPDARKVEASTLPSMTDLVVLISTLSKEVSSSEAHLLVQSSPLWEGRVKRTEQRIQNLKEALKNGDIATISKIAWDEMWEMHSLFHTCKTPFTYWEPATISVIRWVAQFLSAEDPPIVTLDAGPNVHILVETSKAAVWKRRIGEAFPNLKILEDTQGMGASWL